MSDIYHRLADHLAGLVMGYPFSEALLTLLRESFSTEEAAVLLGLPNGLDPFQVVPASTVAANLGRTEADVEPVLARLVEKNLIHTRQTDRGRPGYSLLQIGYGMPQTHFWAGNQDERARKMGYLVYKYFNPQVTETVYGAAKVKSYRYVPVGAELDIAPQGVLPHDRMAGIVAGATKIAVGHCPCRTAARAAGRTDCPHELENCIKYDELAEYLIDRNLGRALSADEAMYILDRCEDQGLVHMVDNAQGKVNHTCNCCGCYCWNVGLIKRRKIKRDNLMAVYFLRSDQPDECIGCGACVDICPVKAVELVDGRAAVDPDWCIGCGVCAPKCPVGLISLKRRFDDAPPGSLPEMFNRIRADKKLLG